ncbi:MAG: acetyltransferase including N-acetylase of ribosomal protein-like protein [Frankiales bacterium]|nr:acetyltransferase including N-acetylase of ribosomal protein-like protein [Frankiales bacterium]
MTLPPLPTGEPLTGRHVRLTRLTEGDLLELAPLLADPGIYASGYVMHRRPVDAADGVALGRERFLNGQGTSRHAYAVRLTDRTLVGTSSLLDADPANERIHIGATLYGVPWWGTAVNPETKLLLLGHCFALGYGRVKIQTDLLNTRSQAAIARLGAQREGVLRRHRRREDGTFRDTVVFSVLREEWPQVRASLEARLQA